MPVIDVTNLKAHLEYEPETGLFRWRINGRGCGGKVKAGKVAGMLTPAGYVRIGIGGKMYMAHCLAWLYMTGDWPKQQIDHRDRNRSNNRWANLREATRGQNRANAKVNANNALGIKGVSRRGNSFHAYIGIDGKQVHLGIYPTLRAAVAMRRRAEKSQHGEFAREL